MRGSNVAAASHSNLPGLAANARLNPPPAPAPRARVCPQCPLQAPTSRAPFSPHLLSLLRTSRSAVLLYRQPVTPTMLVLGDEAMIGAPAAV